MIALLLGFVIAACVIEVCLIKTIPQRSTSVLTAHYTYSNSKNIGNVIEIYFRVCINYRIEGAVSLYV